MLERMRIVFCGTPQFAVPTLKHLLEQVEFKVVGVITQPDRRQGRGLEITFSPVKEAALAAKVPVHQPRKIRDPETETLLKNLAPDCIVTMRIDAGMDTGDTLLRHEMEIARKETALELATRMSEIGGQLMANTLRGLATGSIAPRPQNHAEASHAPLLKKEDGRIDWKRPAAEIYNRMRGFAPWPGAYTRFRGETCHVWGEPVSKDEAADLPSDVAEAAPGTLSGGEYELLVKCGGATVLRLSAVKLEGRKLVKAADFANGARLKTGERFGDSWFA